jgi:hypothetical protein
MCSYTPSIAGNGGNGGNGTGAGGKGGTGGPGQQYWQVGDEPVALATHRG